MDHDYRKHSVSWWCEWRDSTPKSYARIPRKGLAEGSVRAETVLPHYFTFSEVTWETPQRARQLGTTDAVYVERSALASMLYLLILLYRRGR